MGEAQGPPPRAPVEEWSEPVEAGTRSALSENRLVGRRTVKGRHTNLLVGQPAGVRIWESSSSDCS